MSRLAKDDSQTYGGENEVSSFREQLVTMVELQRAEIEIARIEKDMAGIDERIEALNTEVTDFEKNVAEAMEHLDKLKKQYRSDEGEIQSIDAQIEKSQEKLRAVKTNKEYQSTLKEIEDLKEKASGIEDRMIEGLEEIEHADGQVAGQKADLEEVKIDVASKQTDIKEKGEAQQQDLDQWQKVREDILGNIDGKMQELYRKVKRQSNGLAMAAIQEGICDICRMNIPPQLFNELMRMDSMRMCPHCQRIMYPKDVELEIE